MRSWGRARRPPDFLLFLTVLGLLSVGLVMVFSASEYAALVRFNDTFYFFKRQLLYSFLGLGAMFYFLNYDYHNFRRFAGLLLALSFFLLLLVLLPGVGHSSHGAQRWLKFGPLTLQPSEVIKFGIVVFTAYGLSRVPGGIRRAREILPYLGITCAAALLILLQPDLGTAMALAGTVFVMLFCAGAPLSALGVTGLGGVAAALAAIYMEPYRWRRLLAFLDPWKDPQGSGFHIIQSLYAIGSGGLFGVGLGQGKQKFLYLPEQHTDFIFAVIGEELGFIGGAFVILLFIIFIWRGLRIALYAPDAFGSFLAAGITAGIGLQALINIGVVTGSMPITGIPLPLISYGGTSLVFTLAAIGVLLNISRHTVR
ncbi:stage V sporulation protein E [Thermodesulfitimonas autotrophica]|uniref:Probable peptidoglycan glycosyltransferase FtsW n=1 Tax=Thermodesulfitimonas autotrophica TaxID=1894989 RepID=A0A3N5BSN7_9THEO|nr:stage V sporulation protein E [Thermodesulfitimonas autotrophica]RPF46781.1 cell division protein FtsW [Thermodesulfitimonas autotrophica]